MFIRLKQKNINISKYGYVQNGKYKGIFGKIILINRTKVLILYISKKINRNIYITKSNICLL